MLGLTKLLRLSWQYPGEHRPNMAIFAIPHAVRMRVPKPHFVQIMR
jgi:hypothetical protein